MTPHEAGLLPVESADEFDALRAHWATLPVEPRVVTRENRPAVPSPGGPIHILLRGEETGGEVGLYEQICAVGPGVGLHHQTTEDETFYVLEGIWEFQAGDVVRQAGPGTLIYAPRGTPHAFRALEGPDGKARMLSWNAPAGHERFYVGMGDAKARGLVPRVDAAPKYHTVFA